MPSSRAFYKSADPLLQDYYRRRTNRQLDDMALKDIGALVRVILRETRKFTDRVGGDDQIAEFPAGGDATFHLPNALPTETQAIPRVMRWEGCSARALGHRRAATRRCLFRSTPHSPRAKSALRSSSWQVNSRTFPSPWTAICLSLTASMGLGSSGMRVPFSPTETRSKTVSSS